MTGHVHGPQRKQQRVFHQDTSLSKIQVFGHSYLSCLWNITSNQHNPCIYCSGHSSSLATETFLWRLSTWYLLPCGYYGGYQPTLFFHLHEPGSQCCYGLQSAYHYQLLLWTKKVVEAYNPSIWSLFQVSLLFKIYAEQVHSNLGLPLPSLPSELPQDPSLPHWLLWSSGICY